MKQLPVKSAINSVIISWQRWPLIEAGKAGSFRGALVALLVTFIWLVLIYSLPFVAAFLLSAAFTVLVLPYYLPVFFSLTGGGVLVQRGFFPASLKPWTQFSRYEKTPGGFWLIPSPGVKTFGPQSLRPLFLPSPLDSLVKERAEIALAGFFPLD